MIGLIVLIIVCFKIYDVGKEKGISSTLFILGAIFLAIVPSIFLRLVMGNFAGVPLISAIMSIILCLIPYKMIKN